MKPASSEYIPSGQAGERPSRRSLPATISMMTTGSVRGKCWAPQAGQVRRQPPSVASEAAPQAGAEAMGGVPAEDALGRGGGARLVRRELGHQRAQVAEAEARRAGPGAASGVASTKGAGPSPAPTPGQSGIARAKRGSPALEAEEDRLLLGRGEERRAERLPAEPERPSPPPPRAAAFRARAPAPAPPGRRRRPRAPRRRCAAPTPGRWSRPRR